MNYMLPGFDYLMQLPWTADDPITPRPEKKDWLYACGGLLQYPIGSTAHTRHTTSCSDEQYRDSSEEVNLLRYITG